MWLALNSHRRGYTGRHRRDGVEALHGQYMRARKHDAEHGFSLVAPQLQAVVGAAKGLGVSDANFSLIPLELFAILEIVGLGADLVWLLNGQHLDAQAAEKRVHDEVHCALDVVAVVAVDIKRKHFRLCVPVACRMLAQGPETDIALTKVVDHEHVLAAPGLPQCDKDLLRGRHAGEEGDSTPLVVPCC